MLHEVAEGTETEPIPMRDAYETLVRDAIEAVGVDTVVSETDLDRETVTALAEGDSRELSVEEAAAVIALDADRDAETIVFELRDHLLMGMTTAVLDVDTIAAESDADMDAKEIQQKIEGRMPMPLSEYARLHHFIASRNGR